MKKVQIRSKKGAWQNLSPPQWGQKQFARNFRKCRHFVYSGDLWNSAIAEFIWGYSHRGGQNQFARDFRKYRHFVCRRVQRVADPGSPTDSPGNAEVPQISEKRKKKRNAEWRTAFWRFYIWRVWFWRVCLRYCFCCFVCFILICFVFCVLCFVFCVFNIIYFFIYFFYERLEW